MCGIAGFAAPDGSTSQLTDWIRSAVADLAHRGPDGEGVEFVETAGIGFGHRRLSIIDLSPGGHQPMWSQSKRYLLTYNGEIYNYRAIRNELRTQGVKFQSESDTEVMLAAFEQYGVREALLRFDGMFAFGLFDTHETRLVLGRDRFGEKPLVFSVVDRNLVFASEVRQLRMVKGFDSTIDLQAAHSVLDVGYVRQDRTIYAGARRVLPGECVEWEYETRSLTQWTWWNPVDRAIELLASRRPVAPDRNEVDRVLKASVASRMEADVPLGLFLSGGIDSSLVAALAQSSSSRPIKTFTIGLEDERRSEANEAAAIAKHLGTDHHTLTVTDQDALDLVPQLPSMFDEPFADSSQIPTHLVSKLARSHITVALTGDGGDELFGGYNRHMLASRLNNHFGRPRATFSRSAANVAGLVPAAAVRGAFKVARSVGVLQSWKGDPADALSKAARLGGAANGYELYSQLVFTGSTIGRVGRGLGRIDQAWQAKGFELAERMMLADTLSYLPGDILTKVDRASMFVGLETRAPFLSPDAFDLSWTTAIDDRVSPKVGKQLLRSVLSGYVPEAMWDRPKTGFGVPIDLWLAGPLQQWAQSVISQMPSTIGVEAAAAVGALWKSRPANWQHGVWNALMLTTWLVTVGGQL